MIRSPIAAAVSLIVAAGLSVPATAAPCRDAHGKFVKCAPKATPAATRCKDAKGRFVKCGKAGSRP